MARPTRSLSKSKLNAYHQCPRRLWLEVHKPELAVDSQGSTFAFSIGHAVGAVAQGLYPDGILVGPSDLSAGVDWKEVLAETEAALSVSPRRPIFEATCQHGGVLVRADLLLPARRGWHMAEVKSATMVKDYYLNDVALQTWVMRSYGVDVRTVEVRHINKAFVYQGRGDYSKLFMAGDVQEEVEQRQSEVPRWVKDAKSIVASSEPRRDMGAHCNDPYECPFQEHCSKGMAPGPKFPVSLLPGSPGKKLARKLMEEGYGDLRKVPAKKIPEGQLSTIHQVTLSGKAHLDKPGAKAAMSDLAYPRFYFDFETISPAVPLWKGTTPYQKLPFQWSCDIERSPGVFEHVDFLDLSGKDPSRPCAEALIKALERKGPILVYHAPFERGVLAALAMRYEDLELALSKIIARIVDLEDFVKAHYYHPEMMGSYSIKAVLPTIAPDLDYGKLEEVQDGNGAQVAYLDAIDPNTPEDRVAQLRSRLLTYCGLDTWAMVVLAWHLAGKGRPPRPA